MCDAYCVHDVSAAASEQQSNNARPLWTTTNAIISIQPFAVLFLRRVDDRDFERRTFRKSISSPLARFHLQISLRRRPLRAQFNYLSCSRTRCVRSSVGSFAIYLFRAVMDPRMDYRSLPRSPHNISRCFHCGYRYTRSPDTPSHSKRILNFGRTLRRPPGHSRYGLPSVHTTHTYCTRRPTNAGS